MNAFNSSANNILSEVAEKLQTKIDEKNAHVNVFSVKNKMHTLNQYVFLFIHNFKTIINDYNLTKNEIQVILTILELMQFGNAISITNSTIAKELKIDKSNVSRIMKKLKSTELIVDMNGSLFFNPHIACKGTLDEKDIDDENFINFSYDNAIKNNENLTASIGTKRIRKLRKDNNE